jgi:hypothetical protein
MRYVVAFKQLVFPISGANSFLRYGSGGAYFFAFRRLVSVGVFGRTAWRGASCGVDN